MKGTWAYALTLAVLLTGCSAKPDAPAPIPAETDAASQSALPETAADVQTAAQEETLLFSEFQPAETAALTPPAADAQPAAVEVQGTVIDCYRSALNEKIEAAKQIGAEYAGNNYTIEYTLYDMDQNGTPELLVKYGTCEADYRIAIYTYKDSSLVKIADEMGGSHTSFGYDYKANQLVLLQGHMGGGDMVWYDLDENGELRQLIDTGGFEYGMEGQPEYTDFMKKYNVSYLPYATSFSMGEADCRTYIYEDPADYDSEKCIDALDFSFLENYPF
jgi:hypothetical protein